ncbi:MAG: type II toxin-antitoxin system RelE/ParE family toxin [Acidobacteria bacterium]|nr:type II toxin-antitoxin system RelE/ParE family toxin [Acidobacteriota bacterium]
MVAPRQGRARAVLDAPLVLRWRAVLPSSEARRLAGRPLVDTIKGSRHRNMKELRPGSTGRTEIRVLFAFDVRRRAILLVGGDKSKDWSCWYETNIPIADARFAEHQATIENRRQIEKAAAKEARGPRGRRRR